MAPSLPYHEPGIMIIMLQAFFLLLLNIVNAVLDKLLFCGLLGQVLVGIVWGSPGAKWLSISAEATIVQFGYLGLLLLVYEGGLHASFQALKANLALSSAVALTGIMTPVGLSYTLQGLLDATPLQAFAAGAALCSTSLGTTFTILASSGLSSSRLGVVLTNAAMMDDVAGLVMIEVISNLGGDDFSWITVVRPILVSVAFAIVVPITCLFVLKPATVYLNRYRGLYPTAQVSVILGKTHTAFVLHTTLLIGLVVGASYAGTSNLFAAYIAGATISWWDSELPHPDMRTRAAPAPVERPETSNNNTATLTSGQGRTQSVSCREAPPTLPAESQGKLDNNTEAAYDTSQDQQKGNPYCSGSAIYYQYYHGAVTIILQPLFFASIGFSIPITRMFRGAVIWKGLVYTVLMAFAKLVCGFWLVRFTFTPFRERLRYLLRKARSPRARRLCEMKKPCSAMNMTELGTNAVAPLQNTPEQDPVSSPSPPKPFSLHPPLILALAMCARGEIGFLISGVAESNGIFSSSTENPPGPSDIFLVVTWAIVLCTIIGPLGVGLSVRRVRKLEGRKNKHQEGAGKDVLGVWGMD